MLIVACAALGAVVGLGVTALHEIVLLVNDTAFQLGPSVRFGLGRSHVAMLPVVIVPAVGGALIGLFNFAMSRLRPREIVDPIEANAIHGGRMSLRASLRLTFATILSNSCGASVGMEAAYTQLGAGVLSSCGQKLHLRRSDLRIFVAAGSAAAIAAAFNAPLAGAFYAFELVLANYTTGSLAQVAAATMAGTLVTRSLIQVAPLFAIPGSIAVEDWHYVLFGVVGLAGGVLSIITMRAVGWCEQASRRNPLPRWLQPALGGLLLSAIALGFPQVLGSGQGAIQDHFDHRWPLLAVLGLLIAKIAASAVSIGSGFRGGLFSSSLLIGCLFGEVMGRLGALALPSLAENETAFMLVGMGSIGAGIIGAPVTMVLLVLELTGSLPATLGVLVGVMVSSALVRYTFGYSFSTWRFHLRGVPIHSAHDVGWVSDLTVGKLMQGTPHTVLDSTPLHALRRTIGLGSTRVVFVIDGAGGYVGSIDTTLIHDPDLDDAADGLVASDLAGGRGRFLLPEQNLRDALASFALWAVEELPVLNSTEQRRPIGSLTEAYALRRYSQEFERREEFQYGGSGALHSGGITKGHRSFSVAE